MRRNEKTPATVYMREVDGRTRNGAGAVGTWLMIHQPTPIIAEKCVKINIGGNDYDPVSDYETVSGRSV